MTNEEVKLEKERCFEQIEQSNKRLEELREECNHEKTEECNWSWRIGCSQLADICTYCGEFIRYKE